MQIIPFGSGSTGNSFYIELGDHRFLIDMGIGYRKVKAVLESHERRLEDIEAVFLTHGHADHIKAAKALGNHLSCKVYANETVMYPIRNIAPERAVLDVNEEKEVLPGLQVRMFSVPHDYVRTCGYSFVCEGKKLSYVTDCGRMNEKIFKELCGSDVVIIEANHDVEMLKKGSYPHFLKKRILSEYGHLSNDDCADTVARLYESGTRNFLLAHLSRENNTPERALQTVKERMGKKEIFLYACPVEGQELLQF
ncbi:MAG: MBL fold metallo-hydrolase [Erysipelotrichaceae bacterium]|nr:MBL fold metallo-hydrolase [Erysipelotrichaceae bacterium]